MKQFGEELIHRAVDSSVLAPTAWTIRARVFRQLLGLLGSSLLPRCL